MHLVPFHCPQAGLKSNFVNILNLLHAALSWNSESFLRDVAAENERVSISDIPKQMVIERSRPVRLRPKHSQLFQIIV